MTAKSIEDVLAVLSDSQKRILQTLREPILSEAGVKEVVTRHEDSPTYIFMGKQLFHVHPTERGIGVTIPLASEGLVPRLLETPGVKAGQKQAIRRSRDYRGLRWVFFDLQTEQDVEAFLKLVAYKMDFMAGRGGTRVTLESFGQD